MSWDEEEEDVEPKGVDLNQLMAMVEEPTNPTEPAFSFAPKKPTAAPPKAPAASTPAPAQATRGKKGKKAKPRGNNAFDEEDAEPEAPTAPVSSAVEDDLLAQLDHGLQSQARPEVKPPPSPYKTRTKTVWIEDEVPTRTGSLEAASFPNPLEEKEKLAKAKKLEEAEKEEKEEKEKEEATKAGTGPGGGAKKGNSNNKKGKKKR